MRIIGKYLKKNASLQKTENIVVRQNIDRKLSLLDNTPNQPTKVRRKQIRYSYK